MNDKRKLTIVIVIPFLNEAGNLPLLYERLVAAMASQPEAWELLLVDDGSTDGSAEWIEAKAKADPQVRLLRLSRNFGHQIAITAGLDHADGDAVVIMDADLQDPPEVIPDLLARWREGFEVIYAVRRQRQGETLSKKFLAASFYRVFRALAKVNIPMDAGDFRLVDRKVVLAIREIREVHRFMRGLTSWIGYRQGAVYYDRAARHTGEPKYTIWKSARLAWDALMSFSGAPLRWMMTVGCLLSIGGGILAIRLLIARIRYPAVPVAGWAVLVVVIIVLGGIHLFCLGLLGEYLMRIYEENKKRPLYFLR